MNWIIYTASFLAALAMSWFIVARLPRLMEKRGIYDKKSLPRRVPTAGGLAIAVPFLAVVIFSIIADPFPTGLPQKALAGLFVSATLIALLGLYDDVRNASPIMKISVQAAAGIILVAAGVKMDLITNPLASPIQPGIWGNLLLILWLIVITNAINLIDGIDGLAAGICLISSVTIFAVAVVFGETILALLAAALAGALFGFIRLNLPPARIFLGDTGSLFLGFVLAAISVIERRKGTVTVTLLVPLLVMAVPLMDTLLVFFRRIVSGQNPMIGDKRHLHHRLIKLGFTPVQVNYMLYLFSIYLGVTAVVLSFFPKETAMVVLVLLAVGILLGLELLRHIELEESAATAGDAEE
ncbi:MAG: undecaprenyl-phosphate alpha-N-acetylglucosaminyl 1-phosphate transferase [bacterium]|nr:MAG: undecaprenyl-phosphate alpha-N-acetylglucosaminyl 1-phosphate transferase [bacterium]